MKARKHDLYRLLGEGGELLYIGISLNVAKRMSEHRQDKSWWDDVVEIKRESYPTRVAVLEAEASAIKAEGPKYNVVHNNSSSTKDGSSSMTKDDRLSGAVASQWDTKSLVGSFFHGNEWQGCVVAEPAPGMYLVETFSWAMGESYCQKLVSIGQMTMQKWRFYDEVEWMRNAYDEQGRGVFEVKDDD